MKFFRTILVFSFVAVATSAYAQPNPEKFNLDKDLTYVGFSVNYLIILPVTGRFDDFKGDFVIDHDHPENNHADIIIKTKSINTGSESRNNDIRGPALFNAAQYPEMIFHSDKITLAPDNTGVITGELTLRGVTRTVTLNLIRIPDVVSPGPRTDRGFSDGLMVTGKIKRSDFGMNDYIVPIGDIVTLFVCYKLEKCNSTLTHPSKKTHQYNQ